MAITILPQEGSFSQTLGTGIGNALQNLAAMRTQKMQEQQSYARQAQGLQALLGLSPEVAQQAAYAPESVLKEYAKAQRSSLQTGPGIQTIAPNLSQEQAAKIGQLSPGVQQLWYRNYLDSPQQAIEALNAAPNSFSKPEIKQFAQSNLSEIRKPKTQQMIPAEVKPKSKEVQLDKTLKNLASQNVKQQQQSTQNIIPESAKIVQSDINKEESQLPVEQLSTPKLRYNFLKDRANKVVTESPDESIKKVDEYMKEGLGRKEATDLVKERNKEKLVTLKDTLKENKTTKDRVNHAYEASGDDTIRIDKIEDLNARGNLGFPIFNSIIKGISHGIFGFGLDLTNLMTADAQELDKLSTDFLKNAKQYFGSRMTDTDLINFMKTVPNLLQSKEGRTRVIANMRIFLEAKKIRKEAMDQIIKANRGKPVNDLESKIDEVAKPLLDNLSYQFKQLSNSQPNIAERILQGVGLEY